MTLGLSALEFCRREAACIIPVRVGRPTFKDYSLPLIFRKRLTDVFEDQIKRLV